MLSIEQILGKEKYIKADLQIKAKELKIKGFSTMNIKELTDMIISESNKPITTTQTNVPELHQCQPTKEKKKTIPKPLKNSVWDKYIGKEHGIGNCYSCQSNIDSKHFECGHVISDADGGDLSIENLRPVCSLCNKSMGVMNMNEFIGKLKQDTKLIDIRDIAKEIGIMFEIPSAIPPKINFNHFSKLKHNVSDASYNDDELIKKMNYDKLNFDIIKSNPNYCRIEKLKLFIAKHISITDADFESIITRKAYYLAPLCNYKDFCKLNTAKLIAIFIENNKIIIDADLKKINTLTRTQIDDAYKIPLCDCLLKKMKHIGYFNVYGNDETPFTNAYTYTCNQCSKVLPSKEHEYRLSKLSLAERAWY
jgi:5-methylcytosine-specific restriction endonuclease McrA